MKKVLFIDRDGTIITEPADEQVDSFEKLEFIPGVISALSKICHELDYELVMVTNQDGLGTVAFPEEAFRPVHNKMLQILQGEGISFSAVFIDNTLECENAPTRKPGTAMLVRYLSDGVDLSQSFVIGDRLTDIGLAMNLGCQAVYFSKEQSPDALFNTTNWKEIYNYLHAIPRKTRVVRVTSETSVTVELNLDGTGANRISTGLGFFNHMLEQVARHGQIDLSINVTGDLAVDEHHTVEDVALCLGEALWKALGGKKGIERYGFMLPMDDSLAQVAIDLGGRAGLVWNVHFIREKIGEMPTELFYHFFKSFSDTAMCNLNIKAEGVNEHHMAEALFKAFARALRMAVRQTGSGILPTTKGIL
ncbi:MAG TPA: bifunctional histidinol-phosphatase/imidazoleglycerol-phosphate dehydratase HisB [Bacteroidales bacterium]|nr:bifunctional histidinol-phosphatase/imidazoleglycerol-phosphate dehydratase HisB [Bacteroidales bacterium]